MRFKKRTSSPLRKKARRGFQGFPIATVAYYGPDADRASKVAVGIKLTNDGEPAALERWVLPDGDVRTDPAVEREVLEFVRQHGAVSIAMSPGIIGCPHEEVIDYPEGEVCPRCPYWANRNRWTGEIEGEEDPD